MSDADAERRRRRRRQKKDTDERMRSAKSVLRFALDAPLHADAKKRLLREVLWIATEAGFHKHKLSLRTPAADAEILDHLAETDLGKRVRHEHVYPRRWVVAQILASPADAEALLERYAVACVVTVKEAAALDKVEQHHVGWERYSAANLTVIEVQPDGSIRPFALPRKDA